MFLSEQLVATYWPEGSICTCRTKYKKHSTVHKLCEYCRKRTECGQWRHNCYPEQTAIFTQRSFIELLLFATADVENPALRRKRNKEWKLKKSAFSKMQIQLRTSPSFRNTYLCPLTHLTQRSWQPTAAYLHVGSTLMSYSVAFLTVWWERLNSVPLSVCKKEKEKRNTIRRVQRRRAALAAALDRKVLHET